VAIRFSVIVPTRNRRARLQSTLDDLEAQSFPRADFEVIVVDDGSSDDTVAWLTENARACVCSTRHEGPGPARNAGAAAAHGEYLAFTEDDVRISPDWLERADRHLRANAVDVLEGRTVLEGTHRNTRRAEAVPVPSFIPCNLFVRRSAFGQLGGYSPSFFDSRSGLYFREDADLGFRALECGMTHLIDPTVLVEHPEQFLSLPACFRHARRYVFDPLLYRRHRALYRRYIEVKSIGPLRVHRPMHLVALATLLSWVLLVVGVVIGQPILLGLGAAGVLASGVAVRAKYQGRRALRLWELGSQIAMLGLPAVYLAALVRGCVRARGGVGVFV
jgi:glycosyltransferase involved in cell wall biosynthesis